MRKYKIGGIIQARTGSKRLPGKMLLKINGLSVLEWVILRTKLSRKIDTIILATTCKSEDDELEKIGLDNGVKVFRGAENDLLNRFYEAADSYKLDIVIRICADNPLISSEVIDLTIEEHIKRKAIFTESVDPEYTGWPDGFGCEVADFSLLKELEHLSISQKEREHVFAYLWEHPKKYSIQHLIAPEKYRYPDIKLDLDYWKDYEFMKHFIETSRISIKSTVKDIILKYREYYENN